MGGSSGDLSPHDRGSGSRGETRPPPSFRAFPFSIPSRRLGVLDGMENGNGVPGRIRRDSKSNRPSISTRAKGPLHTSPGREAQVRSNAKSGGLKARSIGPDLLVVRPLGTAADGTDLWSSILPPAPSLGLTAQAGMGRTFGAEEPRMPHPGVTRGFSIPSRTPRRLDGMENPEGRSGPHTPGFEVEPPVDFHKGQRPAPYQPGP